MGKDRKGGRHPRRVTLRDGSGAAGADDLHLFDVPSLRYLDGFQMSAPRPAAVMRSSAIGGWSASIGSLRGGPAL